MHLPWREESLEDPERRRFKTGYPQTGTCFAYSTQAGLQSKATNRSRRKGLSAMPNEEQKPAATLHRWADITPEQLNPLLTRQFVSGEKAMLSRILLKQGCVVPEHSHHNEQISLVVSGALEFVVSGQTHIVRAGEILVIPPHAPHSATALEDTENLDLFAPPRQDWIEGRDSYLR
jgi:quercetin dioxygenase-like cupin family protein